jgi:hypothetical protein
MTIYFNAQREKPWLQSIDDLRMCRKVDCNRIGVIERSQHEEYFRKEVMNGNQMNYYRLKHPNECFSKLLDHYIDVAISDSSSADYFTQTRSYCQLEVTGIPFGKTYFGVAFPKQWRYKQDLDKNIMELKLNGEIDRLLEKWFQAKSCDRENGDENNGLGDGLTILEVSGLFYVFAGFTGFNVIAFGLYLLYSLYKKDDASCDATSLTSVEVDVARETTPADEQNRTQQLPVDNIDTAPLAHQNCSTHTSSAENREQTYL